MKHFILLLVFIAVFGSHVASSTMTSYDSLWSLPIALNIINDGSVALDNYSDLMKKDDYRIVTIDGRHYPFFPIGTSFVAMPFVYLIEKAVGGDPAETRNFVIQNYRKIELVIASFIVALASVFVYLIARRLLGGTGQSLLVAFIFAFCTSSWSTASRGLWQHGPSMLMLAIALYLILVAKDNPRLIQFASIPLAFSYVIRPTNSVPIVLLSIYVLIEYRRFFGWYLLWAAMIAVPFLVFNYEVYHSLLPPYYLPQRVGGSSYFFDALAGNLVSPARGLFVYSPILIFSIYGIVLKLRRSQFTRLDFFLVATIFLHWILVSSFPHWWGGWSFGPRFFTDMNPYFSYFLIPAVAHIFGANRPRNMVAISVFLCLLLVSCLIHFRGANRQAVYSWNWEPVDVDLKPARLWDWHDIQFLREM